MADRVVIPGLQRPPQQIQLGVTPAKEALDQNLDVFAQFYYTGLKAIAEGLVGTDAAVSQPSTLWLRADDRVRCSKAGRLFAYVYI